MLVQNVKRPKTIDGYQLKNLRRRSTMNYHYIDYMIKERQRNEIEECERRRMLKSAGYSQKVLSHWLDTIFSKIVQHLKELRLTPSKRLPTCVSTVQSVVQIKGVRR